MRLVESILGLSKAEALAVAWVERDAASIITREWTWHEIQGLCTAAVSFLRDLHVRPSDRIVNLAPNSLNWAVLDLACSAINAVHAPLDPRLSPEHHQDCIEQIQPKLIFSHSVSQTADSRFRSVDELLNLQPCSHRLADACSPYSQDDIANILFTSGTSSKPRGVMLTHRNLMTNANAKLEAMPQISTDHRLNFLPFSHAYARTCELTTWMISKSRLETVSGIATFLKGAKIAQPSLINGVPALYDRIEQLWQPSGFNDEALREILGDNVRRLASGGAAINDALRARFASAGLPIFQGYGLTEASPVVCSNRSSRPGNNQKFLQGVGPAVQGVRIRIDSASKLWISGEGVMAGYWNDPSATRARIVDGWLDTGDLAEYIPEENSAWSNPSLRILGRSDETIVLSNGYKIHPSPIENKLKALDWIKHCLVVGTDRPFVILILVVEDAALSAAGVEPTPAAVLNRIKIALECFPDYAVPKRVVLVREVWQLDSRLCNFKGALLRKKIAQHYGVLIEEQFHST